MTYYYEVYYEGKLQLWSDKKLTENEVLDEAVDIIRGDDRTRLDHDCSEENIEVIDEWEDD